MSRALCRALALLAISSWLAPAADAQWSRLSGTVTDSLHHVPLSHATVTALPTGATRDTAFHIARTDGHGHFTLDAMPPGTWTLSVEHPLTDSIGLDVPARDVLLPRDAATEIALGLPSAATIRRTLCPAALADTSLGVILGVVRRPDGAAAAGARVVFTWTDYVADATSRTVARQERTATVNTDSLGVYRACGLPATIALLVQAQAGENTQSGVVEERISDAGVLVRYLTLGSGPAVLMSRVVASDTTSATATGTGVVAGTVTSTRSPIPGAQVRLFGTERLATTNQRGEFRLAGLPTGTQGFEVTALGYSPRRLRADVGTSTPPLAVRLDRISAVLDSVRITARRQYDGVRYSEFDQRLARGSGRFVTEEAIARTHPFIVSDLLRMMGGFGTIVDPDGRVRFVQTRGVSSLRSTLVSNREHPVVGGRGTATGMGSGQRCPTVFVNGVEDPDGEVDRVVPASVHGIEVYRSGEVPAKYRALCGAILIWTK